jgi:hypothetical protein
MPNRDIIREPVTQIRTVPLRRSGVELKRPSVAGQKNPAWKGGRCLDDDGYVLIHAPLHPHARKDGYVLESRLVMEKIIGRFLEPGEVVHHRHEPKTDNSPENLQLYSSNAEHLRDELKGKRPEWTEEGFSRMGHHRKRSCV